MNKLKIAQDIRDIAVFANDDEIRADLLTLYQVLLREVRYGNE